MIPIHSQSIDSQAFLTDLANTLSRSGRLLEIALADSGGSKFNRGIYFKEIAPDILGNFLKSSRNVSFLADINPDSINTHLNRETFRQSKNNSITSKSIVSFDLDLKDMHPGFKELERNQQKTLLNTTAAKILEKGKQARFPFWVVNYSGNGIHIHFKLKEPIQITSGKDYKSWYNAWIDQLQMILGSSFVFDKACSNPARVIRLPGSINWKDQKNPLAADVIFHDPSAEASQFITPMNLEKTKQELTLTKILKHFGYKKFDTIQTVGDQQICSSPFTQDSQPSFYFHAQKQLFYDFSIGLGGNIHQLIAKLAGKDLKKHSGEVNKVVSKLSGKNPQNRINRFSLRSDGVWFAKSFEDDEECTWICSPLEIKAAARNQQSECWGRILSFPDQDGVMKTWSMPMELLAGDGLELRKELLRRGVRISTNRASRQLLMDYIQSTEVSGRVHCVDQIGWQNRAYVLPHKIFGSSQDQISLQKLGEFSCFQRKGSLQEWQKQVAKPCDSNSRLIFALSAAFTPPLLNILGQESGGVHFVGSSSIGKTLLLKIAGSVWGGGGISGYLRKWRSTVNGLESLAADRNDCLLTLDEISEISPKDAAYATYMLANGSGKKRMWRSGDSQESLEWRIFFMSSGEVSLGNHLSEAGEKYRAGQFVRLVEIDADADQGKGIFDEVPQRFSSAQFADHLRNACSEYYGTPIDAYLNKLVAMNFNEIEKVWTYTRNLISDKELPGQMDRVAKRFALIATSGILASKLGILPFQEDAIMQSIKDSFANWAAHHCTHPDFESEKILSTIRCYLQLHGCAFFPEWDGRSPVHTDKRCCGYRLMDRQSGGYSWLILNEVMQQEICKGLSMRKVVSVLKKNNFLIEKNQRSTRPFRLPNLGLVRVYHLTGDLLV